MQRNKGGVQGKGVKIKSSLPGVKPLPEKSSTDKPLSGRVFYLDIPSKVLSEKLEKDLKDLGGTIEGFLSKEISYLITSKKEAKRTKSLKLSSFIPSPEPIRNSGSSLTRPGSHRNGNQEGDSNKKPEKDDVSRGKSLLKKVIKEQEILPKNSILANALNWGVRILHVDEAKIYIEQKRKSLQQGKPTESATKTVVKQPVRRKAKAQKLKSPYIKVEDSSCLYRPLYLVLPFFRSFQSLPSKSCQSVDKKAATANKVSEIKGLNKTWHGQDGGNNSHCKLREQKKRGYCECCLQKYEDLEAHLVGQQHKNFSQGPNYQDVDNLISMFEFDFVDWSRYRQEAKSSVFLTPSETIEQEQVDLPEVHHQISGQSSVVNQEPSNKLHVTGDYLSNVPAHFPRSSVLLMPAETKQEVMIPEVHHQISTSVVNQEPADVQQFSPRVTDATLLNVPVNFSPCNSVLLMPDDTKQEVRTPKVNHQISGQISSMVNQEPADVPQPSPHVIDGSLSNNTAHSPPCSSLVNQEPANVQQSSPSVTDGSLSNNYAQCPPCSSFLLMPGGTKQEVVIPKAHCQIVVKQEPADVLQPPPPVADGCPLNNPAQRPEPDTMPCTVETLCISGCQLDSSDISAWSPVLIPETAMSPVPADEPFCDEDHAQNETQIPEDIPPVLTFEPSLEPALCQKSSSEGESGRPSKKIKLDDSLVSITSCPKTVAVEHLNNPSLSTETVPEDMEVVCPSIHPDALSGQSPPTCPSKPFRKVKILQHSERKPEPPYSVPKCKASVPVEHFDFSPTTETILSLFESSETGSDFCGFSCNSLTTDKDDCSLWCLFSHTSSSAATFYGF